VPDFHQISSQSFPPRASIERPRLADTPGYGVLLEIFSPESQPKKQPCNIRPVVGASLIPSLPAGPQVIVVWPKI
jgi:hypothetical protein